MAALPIFPRKIEEQWGKDTSEEFISWLDAIENSLDHVKEKQGRQRAGLNQLRTEVNERFDRMNERLQSSLKWTVGVVMGMGSLLAILMSIYKFMG